jgi:hypothetical protein
MNNALAMTAVKVKALFIAKANVIIIRYALMHQGIQLKESVHGRRTTK